jgi:hypothetical protein
MGLLRTVGRTAVISATATNVSNRVSRRQAGRWAAEDQQEAQAPPAAAPAQAAPEAAEPDYVAELTKLAELRDAGILTPEEFEAKKRQVLGI